MSFLDLKERFTPGRPSLLATNGALLKELLGFLLSLNMISSSGEKRWDERSFRAPPRGQIFSLTLLAKLRALKDLRQRAFLGIHDELVQRGTVYTTTGDIVALMEQSRYAACFTWNETKIVFWSRFMADLGLLVYLPPLRVAVSPGSDTLLQVIPNGQHDLRSLLESIHHNFLSVFTRVGDVHDGVARALLRLAKAGTIDLRYESDAAHSITLHGQRLSLLWRAT